MTQENIPAPQQHTALRQPPKVPRPVPAPIVESPQIAQITSALNEGRLSLDEASAELSALMTSGTPLIEEIVDSPQEKIVTFLHYDEQAENVLIFVNRLTDEKNLIDSLMRRVGETNFRTISYRMETSWRASYCFIPSYPGERPAWMTEGNQVQLRAALDAGFSDEFNGASCLNRAGKKMSVIELADAPEQKYLPEAGELEAIEEVEWHRAPSGRLVQVQQIGRPEPDAPALLVLDGEVWEQFGLAGMLRRAYEAGQLPALHLVLIHSGGRLVRWAELDGTAPIADYLADELLPWLKNFGLRPAAHDIVLNGQSLGGLATLLAVLSRPENFGAAISQSASLWQPVVAQQLEYLIAEGQESRLAHLSLEIEVGAQEWVLEPPHTDFVARLEQTPARVNYQVFNGGHDYACWRGAIIPALIRILNS